MAEKKQVESSRKEKNPALAAFLSIFPGVGAIYNGNILKGITQMLIFAMLIILTDHAHYSDEVVFGLMIAGFYVYQIVDSYNEASRLNRAAVQSEEEARPKEDVSLFSAVAVLLLGILFQLANLDLITYRQITRFWPLILIILGIRIVFKYFKDKEEKDEQK